MTDALWIKQGNRLLPADDVTEALLAVIKQGTYVRTDAPRQSRNPKAHRLMMAILSKVVEHTWPRFHDVDSLIWWLKHRSGMVKAIYVIDGVQQYEMESISFNAMDERTFRAVREKWLAIICAPEDEGGLMPGTDPESLLKEGK